MQPNVANMYELIFYANYPKYNQHQSVSIRKAKQIFLDCLVSFSVIILIGNIYYLWKNQYLSQIKILNQGFRVQFFCSHVDICMTFSSISFIPYLEDIMCIANNVN